MIGNSFSKCAIAQAAPTVSAMATRMVKPSLLESSHYLLGQTLFAAEQRAQAGNIDEQIIGLFDADDRAELFAPAGQLQQGGAIGQWIVLLALDIAQSCGFGQRHARSNAEATGAGDNAEQATAELFVEEEFAAICFRTLSPWERAG